MALKNNSDRFIQLCQARYRNKRISRILFPSLFFQKEKDGDHFSGRIVADTLSKKEAILLPIYIRRHDLASE
jgi:hypothetical protein